MPDPALPIPSARSQLTQGIGYALAIPDPPAAVAGVAITKASWEFCFAVDQPQLRVVVTAVLAPVPGPPATPNGPPTPPPAGNATVVELEAIASDADLDAIIAWLGSFKGAKMTAKSRKADRGDPASDGGTTRPLR